LGCNKNRAATKAKSQTKNEKKKGGLSLVLINKPGAGHLGCGKKEGVVISDGKGQTLKKGKMCHAQLRLAISKK